MTTTTDTTTARELADWIQDTRDRVLDLATDLTDEQLMGPQLEIVNPMLWEIGHVAWFNEKWVLRHVAGQASMRPEVDALYDSMAIAHDTRWNLPLLTREKTLAYLRGVADRMLDLLSSRPLDEELTYFVKLGVFHTDMHTEAFAYTRQTLGYSLPALRVAPATGAAEPNGTEGRSARPRGDVEHAGGTLMLGATPDEPFVFDNEKWAHPVEVKPFAMAVTAVTQDEFAAFVDDGGYQRHEYWSTEGWKWRQEHRGEQPEYWQQQPDGRWLRREFDRWVKLEPNRPMLHVNWYEANAYCGWAHRRLPTESEWEFAAAAAGRDGKIEPDGKKRRYPWGEDDPTLAKANLDWQALGSIDVDKLSAGDTPGGCRQMFGNVWEWTASEFLPYPGFVVDPYKDYSEPWFGTRKVLRGGCWTTRSIMLRNTWRNFYTPDRRDVWAGFRTCAE